MIDSVWFGPATTNWEYTFIDRSQIRVVTSVNVLMGDILKATVVTHFFELFAYSLSEYRDSIGEAQSSLWSTNTRSAKALSKASLIF